MEGHFAGLEFFTLPEVASILRCSNSTVYKMVESGKLPANRIGGRLIFDRDMLARWIQDRATSPNV